MCLFIIDWNYSYERCIRHAKSIHSVISVKMAQPSFELEFKGKLYEKYSVKGILFLKRCVTRPLKI